MKKLAILPNHPRARRWSAALIASAIALGACLLSYDNVEAQIRQNRIERLNARIENVYTADYQDMADRQSQGREKPGRGHGRRHLRQREPLRHQHHVAVRVFHHR